MIKKALILTGSMTLVLPMGLAVVSCGSEDSGNKDVKAEMDKIISEVSINKPATNRLTIDELDKFQESGNFTKSIVSQLGLSYRGKTHEDVFIPESPYPIYMKFSKSKNVNKVPGKTVDYTFDVFLWTTVGKTSNKSFVVTSKDRVKSTPGNISKPINADMIANNPELIKTVSPTQGSLRTAQTNQLTGRTFDWEFASRLLEGNVDGISPDAFNPENPAYASMNTSFLEMDFIVIPSTVKMIGKSAFEGNTLKSVDLTSASSLVVMEENAFKGNEINELKMDATTNSSLTVGLGVFEGAKLTELPAALQGDSNLANAFKPFEENFKGSAAGSVDALADAAKLLNAITDKSFLTNGDYTFVEANKTAFTNVSYEELKELVGENEIDALIDDLKFGDYFKDLKFSITFPSTNPNYDDGFSKTYSVEMKISLYGKEVALASGWELKTLPLAPIKVAEVVLNNIGDQSFNLSHDYFEVEGDEIDFEEISWNEFKSLLLPLGNGETYEIDDLIAENVLKDWFNNVRFTLEFETNNINKNPVNNSKTYEATVKVQLGENEITLANEWSLVSKPFNNPLDVSDLNQSPMVTTNKTLVDIKNALTNDHGLTGDDITSKPYEFDSITDLNHVFGTTYEQVSGASSYKVELAKKAEAFKMGEGNAAIIYGITITPEPSDGSSQEDPTPSDELHIVVPKDELSKNFMSFSEGITKAFNGNIFSVMDGSSITQIKDKVSAFIASENNRITSWDVMQLFFNNFPTVNTGYATFDKTAAEQFANWNTINPNRNLYLKVAFRNENNFANTEMLDGMLNGEAGVLELNIHDVNNNSKLGTFNFGMWTNNGMINYNRNAESKLFALNTSNLVFVESELTKATNPDLGENKETIGVDIWKQWVIEKSNFTVEHRTSRYIVGTSIGREKGYNIQYKLNSINGNGDLNISVRGSRALDYENTFVIKKAW